MDDRKTEIENEDEVKAAELRSMAITCTAVPLLSHLIALMSGGGQTDPLNPWPTDRLFALYFASLWGWMLRDGFQVVVARSRLKAKGYAFMDASNIGNAIWMTSILLVLLCWDSILGIIALFIINYIAACLSHTQQNRSYIKVRHLQFIGIITGMCFVAVAFMLECMSEDFYFRDMPFIGILVVLIFLIVGMTLFDFLKIRPWKHK